MMDGKEVYFTFDKICANVNFHMVSTHNGKNNDVLKLREFYVGLDKVRLFFN